MKWWYRWRYRVWAMRAIEASGRMLDIKQGENGILYQSAKWDLERCREPLERYMEKSGVAEEQRRSWVEGQKLDS